MKKIILTIATLVACTSLKAQEGAYISLTGGVTDRVSIENHPESYGAGQQIQLRGGYLFNDKVGLELSVGYLKGNDVQVMKTDAVDVVARARAFGASLLGVYNISDHVYVKAGPLTKVGGYTEVVGKITDKAEFKRHNSGKMPLGIQGVFGTKFQISKHINVFVEMEYLGISVAGNKSTFVSGKLLGQKVNSFNEAKAIVGKYIASLPAEHQAVTMQKISGLIPYFADEVTYVDGTPDRSKFEEKGIDANYSSFGFNIGITYHF